MKIVGLNLVEGGVEITPPSGRPLVLALPHDRRVAGWMLGNRLLQILTDPDEPHARRSPAPDGATARPDAPPAQPDPFAGVEAAIDAGRQMVQAARHFARRRG